MAIVVGVDEAGYGPSLGPLVVTGVVFQVPDSRVEECLWRRLRQSCASSPGDGRGRLIIADSKALLRRGARNKQPQLARISESDSACAESSSLERVDPVALEPRLKEIILLERAVLATLACCGHSPKTLREFLRHIAPSIDVALDEYPWYSAADVVVPASQSFLPIGAFANALRLDCQENNVQFVGAFSEVVPEGHFNRLVGKTRNKAEALVTVVLRVLDRILRLHDGKPVKFCVDRLGGRTHYREQISMLLPGYECTIVEENEHRSAYHMQRSGRVVEFVFEVESEKRYLPVALASLYSKYARELCMLAFNRYWSLHQPELRPTAGYYTDAHRWLSEAQPTLQKLNIDRRRLVRDR